MEAMSKLNRGTGQRWIWRGSLKKNDGPEEEPSEGEEAAYSPDVAEEARHA